MNRATIGIAVITLAIGLGLANIPGSGVTFCLQFLGFHLDCLALLFQGLQIVCIQHKTTACQLLCGGLQIAA